MYNTRVITCSSMLLAMRLLAGLMQGTCPVDQDEGCVIVALTTMYLYSCVLLTFKASGSPLPGWHYVCWMRFGGIQGLREENVLKRLVYTSGLGNGVMVGYSKRKLGNVIR